LVSAAPESRLGVGFQLPVRSSRGNYWEAGVARTLGGHLRLDASYYYRTIHNAKDDDLLLNTGVSFPISFDNAKIRCLEVKLSMRRWGRFSGYLRMVPIGALRAWLQGREFLHCRTRLES